MRSLRLTQQQVQAIVEQAQTDAPQEICGLISGENSIATHIFPITNHSATPEQHFEMEPIALLKAYKHMDATGTQLLAVYHSHPASDPIPSPTDIRDAMRHMPNLAHLIVSLKHEKPRLQAWYIHNVQVDRVELLIGKQPSHATKPLTQAQIVAIVLTTIVAAVLLLTISIALLPPAPPIPTP